MKNLTRTLSLVAILAVLFNSCKKEDSASCSDGIMNGTETGIDCGGSDCPACPTCTDGILNGDETDVDCGGSCPACATCTDGIQNGDETGVDCGGPDCIACPTCTDGIQNGDETGVDCGGSCAPCLVSCGTVTDIDGNVYNTVEIGNQCWITENLKTSTYNDNTPIPNVTDGAQWSGLSSGAYCYYSNDPSLGETYGKLYNRYAASSGKLCPNGWHIPTTADMDELITFLGGEQVAGGKLKSNNSLWNAPNEGATNSSGFSALPAGNRLPPPFSNFANLGGLTRIWTSDSKSMTLSTDSPSTGLSSYDSYMAHSCRCVKD